MICPHCGQETEQEQKPLVSINGEAMKIVRRQFIVNPAKTGKRAHWTAKRNRYAVPVLVVEAATPGSRYND